MLSLCAETQSHPSCAPILLSDSTARTSFASPDAYGSVVPRDLTNAPQQGPFTVRFARATGKEKVAQPRQTCGCGNFDPTDDLTIFGGLFLICVQTPDPSPLISRYICSFSGCVWCLTVSQPGTMPLATICIDPRSSVPQFRHMVVFAIINPHMAAALSTKR